MLVFAISLIKIPFWIMWILLQLVAFVFQKILHEIFD